jgi:hypothetical protein
MLVLEKAFGKIGASVIVRPGLIRPWNHNDGRPAATVDVRGGRKHGEYFDIVLFNGAEPEVIHTNPGLRHLVLMVRQAGKAKFLCGHDERHWFCAAVPGPGVSTVATAIRSLRPAEAWSEGVKRQGEWFFRPLSSPEAAVLIHSVSVVHRREPISRGRGSKPHICQEVVRRGGVAVMVCNRYPSGIPREQYDKLILRDPAAAGWGWRAFTRDARVFARGAVRHADHATLHLREWHEVYLNNERLAAHARSVVFLD